MFLKKFFLKIGLLLIICTGLIWGLLQNQAISDYVNNYGIAMIEEQFGSARLAPEQEALILSIAQEMGITRKIEIRKMNSTALNIFGYHNAFVIFPAACNWLMSVCSVPVLYASASFFEDITLAEQRFLIGHELIHAREGHCRFEGIIRLVSCVLIMTLAVALGIHLVNLFLNPYWSILSALLVFLGFWGVHLVSLHYRRQIEYQADLGSFQLLHSYDGFLGLNQRWQKEFGHPKHNSAYFGLLADHPSCHEREQICLELQKTYLAKK